MLRVFQTEFDGETEGVSDMKLTQSQKKHLLRIAHSQRFCYEAGYFDSVPERKLIELGLAENFVKNTTMGGEGAISRARLELYCIRLTKEGKNTALLLLYPELKNKNFIVDKCSCGWIYPLFPSTKLEGVKRPDGWFKGMPCKNDKFVRCSSKVTFGKYNRKTKRYE